MDERLTGLVPEDPVARYNLACSFALVGRRDEALQALGRAIELGYREPEHMAADPDLESIRDDPRFAKLVDELETEADL